MDRKMNTGKLRNLKDFLSSTKNVSTTQSQLYLNQRSSCCGGDSTLHEAAASDNNYHNSSNLNNGNSTLIKSTRGAYRRASKNAISLFNLMSTGTSGGGKDRDKKNKSIKSKSPITVAAFEDEDNENDDFMPYRSYNSSNPPNKSVSMYGLSMQHHNTTEDTIRKDTYHSQQNSSGGRNLASRLFYTIRSKFRRKARDRNKIVDSKSTDFGSFFSEKENVRSSHSSSAINNRHPLKSSSSVDNVLDSLFSFGSRPRHIPSYNSDVGDPEEDDNVNVENEYEVPDEAVMSMPNQNNDTTEEAVSNLQSHLHNNHHQLALSISPPFKPMKCLTKELEDLLHYGWYWAGLSKEESEAKLKGQPDGAFVVRDSSSDHYLLSLSFNCNGRTLHTRIEYRNGHFSFYSSDADCFPTVAELIDHCMAFSELGVYCYSSARRSDCPSYPVRLTKPVSRLTEVKSLVYLSRFVIRQYVRLDLIPHLPLPQSLIEFVSEQRYV